jgi:predicted PurR-regulated permease PerM
MGAMFKFLQRKDNTPIVELTIANRTVVRILALIILSILFLAALKTAQHALTLIFIAFFLALALNAPVHWIDEHLPGKRKGGSRSLATAVSFLLVVAVIAAFLASIVPPIIRQSNNLIASAPSLVDDVRDQNSSVGKFVRRYHLQSQVNTFSRQLGDRLKHVTGTAVSTITAFGTSVFSVLTVLVLTYMMLLEGPRWLKKFHDLVPTEKQAYASKLTGDMYQVIRGYVNGQVLLAAIASLLIAPMLFFLHISYPIALIFVVFICGLIPMVGHTIGAIIVTTVALFHSLPSAVLILAYYILYQQIENYLIQPRIQANSTNLSPLLVFVAVVIGVSFSGLLGGLVAIPIMGCIRVIAIDQIKRRHMLHEAVEP